MGGALFCRRDQESAFGREGCGMVIITIIFVKNWSMKNILVFLSMLAPISGLMAQQVVDLQDNIPYEYNGLQYGYYITNETSKEVKGENYDRYEVNLYVTNKNNCIKMIPLSYNSPGSSGSGSGTAEVQLAEFSCTNATGKRLTAKKGSVAAKPWYTNVRIPDETTKEKYKTVYAQVGYAIRSGQTFSTRIIVIVPKGEKPKLNCRLIYIPDVQ